MCELTQELKRIAEKLIKMEHRTISKTQTEEDKQNFVNASVTIQQHAIYLQNTL